MTTPSLPPLGPPTPPTPARPAPPPAPPAPGGAAPAPAAGPAMAGDRASTADPYAETGDESDEDFAAMQAALAASADQQLMDALFAEHLGRAPEQAGLGAWAPHVAGMRAAGASDAEVRAWVASQVKGSAEYQVKHPEALVTTHFQHCHGRAPTAQELATWTAEVARGKAEGLSDQAVIDRVGGGIGAVGRPAAAAGLGRAGEARTQAAGAAPFISQYSPDGAEGGYTNGPSNCGPTSVAMIVRAFGGGEGMTDAQLINHLGAIAGTGEEGTSVNGIAAMAEAEGLRAEQVWGDDMAWLSAKLAAGEMVVANGDYYAMAPHRDDGKTGGHYIAVVGQDAAGNFLVNDPADQPGGQKTVTPAEMRAFLNERPGGGNMTAIGSDRPRATAAGQADPASPVRRRPDPWLS